MSGKTVNFSIKDLLALVLVISLSAGWYVSSRELAENKAATKVERQKYHRLDIQDPSNIGVVEIPALFSRKLWQWRVHIPATGEFQIRAAYNDLRPLRAPNETESEIDLSLPPGETVVSVLLDSVDGKWTLVVGRHRQDDSASDSEEVLCKETKWIDDNDYGAMAAGDSGTSENDANKPMVLLHLKDSNYDVNGIPAPWNDPALGVLLWIEKVKPR